MFVNNAVHKKTTKTKKTKSKAIHYDNYKPIKSARPILITIKLCVHVQPIISVQM